MKGYNLFFLVFAIMFSITTMNAQSTRMTTTPQSSAIGADVDWVQDWGTVSVPFKSDAKNVTVNIPKDDLGRQISINFNRTAVESVYFIDDSGQKIKLDTRDGKTFMLNPKRSRSGGNRGEFIEIYHPTGEDTGVVNFEKFRL